MLYTVTTAEVQNRQQRPEPILLLQEKEGESVETLDIQQAGRGTYRLTLSHAYAVCEITKVSVTTLHDFQARPMASPHLTRSSGEALRPRQQRTFQLVCGL